MIQCSRCLKQDAVMQLNKQWLCADCYRAKTGRCPVCKSTDCTTMRKD